MAEATTALKQLLGQGFIPAEALLWRRPLLLQSNLRGQAFFGCDFFLRFFRAQRKTKTKTKARIVYHYSYITIYTIVAYTNLVHYSNHYIWYATTVGTTTSSPTLPLR